MERTTSFTSRKFMCVVCFVLGADLFDFDDVVEEILFLQHILWILPPADVPWRAIKSKSSLFRIIIGSTYSMELHLGE